MLIRALAWRDERNLRLEIRSPYLEIARADAPFDSSYQLQSSQFFAERIVNAHSITGRRLIHTMLSICVRRLLTGWPPF